MVAEALIGDEPGQALRRASKRVQLPAIPTGTPREHPFGTERATAFKTTGPAATSLLPKPLRWLTYARSRGSVPSGKGS
jgi:hypothetical protein